MNLHGYSSTRAVVEDACDLLQAGRLVYVSERWWWSVSKAGPSFSDRIAEPFDTVLRAEGLTPERLRDKFAARDLLC